VGELIRLSNEEGVGIVTIDNPPVNALSTEVAEALERGLEAVESRPSLMAVVLIGAGRTFVAGADINELAKAMESDQINGPELHPLLSKVENLTKPVIAALHGTALGGGLELAMAAHYRVAVSSAKMGQPEVNLGLIPGGEGTQRLPRLVGVAKAVDMCISGASIDASEARALGLIDRIVEGDLLSGAVSFAKEMAAGRSVHPKTSELKTKLRSDSDYAAIFAAGRKQAARLRRNMIAPVAALEALEAATVLPFEEGCKKERDLFQKCLASGQARALVHAFLGERQVAKIPDIPPDTPVLPIRKVAVIGAGTMGREIAMAFVNSGVPVLLKEVDSTALDRGLGEIRKSYERSIKRGRITAEVMAQRLALIQPRLTYEDVNEADLLIEAVFESLELKKRIFAEFDKVAKPECVLATNTSALDVDAMAAATARPQVVIGLHFFNPATIMRLLEIVRGKETSKQVVATALSLAKVLHKVGVVVGNCFGFVGNRMMLPYIREAISLVQEGATLERVDRILYDWGMAMGIFAVSDVIGLDVLTDIYQQHQQADKQSDPVPVLLERLYRSGKLGQKTGAGWYRYDENGKRASDPEILALIRSSASESGIHQREISDEEILDRCIYALINEGGRILEEGYAVRAVDIDIIYLNGYGFPAYRGGPMFYADTVGLASVYDRVREFQSVHGALWEPAPLLRQLAEEGRKFSSFDSKKRPNKAE